MSPMFPLSRPLTLVEEFRLLHHRLMSEHPRAAKFTHAQLIHELMLPMLAGIGAEKWEDQAFLLCHDGEDLPALLLGENVYVLKDEDVCVISTLAQELVPAADPLLRETVLDLFLQENALIAQRQAVS